MELLFPFTFSLLKLSPIFSEFLFSNSSSLFVLTGHPDATFGYKLHKTKTCMFDSTGFTCLTLSRNSCATLEAFQMVPCGWDVILQGNSHDISTVGWYNLGIILNSLPNWLIWCCDVSLLSPMRPLHGGGRSGKDGRGDEWKVLKQRKLPSIKNE